MDDKGYTHEHASTQTLALSQDSHTLHRRPSSELNCASKNIVIELQSAPRFRRERCLRQKCHAFLKVPSGCSRGTPASSKKHELHVARLLERPGGPSAPQRVRSKHGWVEEQFANALVPPSSEGGDSAAQNCLTRRSIERGQSEEPARDGALEGDHFLLPSSCPDFSEGQRDDHVVSRAQCDVCEAALQKLPRTKEAAETHEEACSKIEPVFGYRDSCEREQNLQWYWGSPLWQLKTSPDPAERPGLGKSSPSEQKVLATCQRLRCFGAPVSRLPEVLDVH